jgi:hypothetical protein
MKKIILSLVILIISLYLTQAVNQYTIDSTGQFISVFSYFLIFISVVIFVSLRHISKKKLESKVITKNLWFSIATALLLLVLFNDQFNVSKQYRATSIVITAIGDKNESSHGSEVWLTGIVIDQQKEDLSLIEHSSDWEFKEGALFNHSNQPATLNLSIPEGKNIKLQFLAHNWSGKVSIKDGSEQQILDLYSNTPIDSEYTLKSNNVKASILSLAIIYTMAFVLLSGMLFLMLNLATGRKGYSSLIFLVVYYFVFKGVTISFNFNEIVSFTYFIGSVIIGILFVNMLLPLLKK